MTVECSLACMKDACRVGYGEIISDASISDFRKLMLLELHQRKLHPIPPEGILPAEQYYAVDYVETYYIGHVLSQADSFVRFKFLHRVGAKSFDWPSRVTLMICTSLACFMAPSPWTVLAHLLFQNSKTLKKRFKEIKKQRKSH